MDLLLSIVIPVYNEGNHIVRSLQSITREVEKAGYPFELIIIDDGSKDDTWEKIGEAQNLIPNIRGYRFSRNFGKEAALCAGLDQSNGDAVILMDCDLQHPPHLIYEMVRKWSEEGYEVVECIKSSRGKESILNKVGAQLFYKMIDRLSGYKLKGASDFKLLDKKVVDAWRELGERNVFFRGMSVWLGFKRAEVTFEVPARTDGHSNWSIRSLLKLAVDATVSFSSIPLRLVTIMGAIFFVLSVVLGIQTLVNKITGEAITGFTTVILLLLVIGSILMICLGIIGEYIAAIYHEVKQRPRYIISERAIGMRTYNRSQQISRAGEVKKHVSV